MIVDDLLGTGDHGVILRWHMIDAPHTLDEANRTCRLQTPAGDFTIAIASGMGLVSRLGNDPSPKRKRVGVFEDGPISQQHPRARAWGSEWGLPNSVATPAGTRCDSQTLTIARNQVSPDKVQGIASRYYGHLMPAPTLEFATWENMQ